MAASAARHIASDALRAAKAAHGVGSAAPGTHVALARKPRARSLPARGRTALHLCPQCAAAAADGADHSSPTISVRVRLSGAAGPTDLVVDVNPHATTPRVLAAHWAAELGISAAICTAVARTDHAGADEVPLDGATVDTTLSAAGVADGGVVLVQLAPGYKLITLSLSADKSRTVLLLGDNELANMLRRYNAVALRKVVDAVSPPQELEMFGFGALESGATYAPVPRELPAVPAVRNVTLSCELLPPDANGDPLQPLMFPDLTDGSLDSLLRDLRARGLSTTRLPPHALLRSVAKLADGASYYVVPLTSGGIGEIDTLKQQARWALGAKHMLRGSVVGVSTYSRSSAALTGPPPPRIAPPSVTQVSNLIGHNTNLATGLEHEAGECVRGIVSALHPGGDVVRVREKLHVSWNGKALEIDEVVLAMDGLCAYVVEAENVLTESSGDEMQKRLDAIECVRHAPIHPPCRLYADVADAHIVCATRLFVCRGLKDKPWCPVELRVFNGKQVHGVLCGRSVQLKQSPSRFASPEAMVADWKARGYYLVLPSGTAPASGDSLFSTSEFSC